MSAFLMGRTDGNGAVFIGPAIFNNGGLIGHHRSRP